MCFISQLRACALVCNTFFSIVYIVRKWMVTWCLRTSLAVTLRENATADKVKEAHRRVMVANHPDAGGSHYLASKINEAKDVMLGKTRGKEQWLESTNHHSG
ncbi:Mitochondrial import inner membrane translocase subunit TIM14-3 [Vitis vinifera]|uniref:Mitochondrial import inner membrane translocase subunit TIM14-3 n=1 Tax=Vitis vinifera TaxID=29760 RepID=A0A438CQH0_VITVI|nr:Mitochondrial import inner membrane translocase subunit TIM14-3 [Vitis vinifera]